MRTGIFGGTFDPIHRGHIELAQAAKKCCGLDRVLLMVTATPPHKSGERTDGRIRSAVAKTAVSGLDGIYVCDMELERGGKSYTADTLEELHRLYPDDELVYIVGADMLENLPNWYMPERICSLASIVGANRGGSGIDAEGAANVLRERYGARVRVIDVTPFPVSSTEIRSRIHDALSVRGLLPESAEFEIYKNLLYMPDDVVSAAKKLKDELSPERFLHSIGTMMAAVELASKYGADTKKARLAGLLHDCAKLGDEKEAMLAEKYALKVPADLPGALLHSSLGSAHARKSYGINDEDVLDAILFHTTGRPAMTPLEKAVFLADKLEPTRSNKHAGQIRKKEREAGLDAGIIEAMRLSIEYTLSKGLPVHQSTELSLKYMINKNGGIKMTDTREQVLSICELLDKKKAEDIVAIHVGDKTIIAEWFIICSGHSAAQVKALCDELDEKYGGLGLDLRRKEGYAEGRWIVLDFANILVHIFHPEERQYYNMERLWIDTPDACINYSAEVNGN